MYHRFISLGATGLLAVFAFLTVQGIGPLLRDDVETASLVGYLASGVAVVMTLVALFVLKSRVPRLAPGQSVDQYWNTPANANGAKLVWFILEGAATLAAVAFLLSGLAFTIVLAAAAVLILWMMGPGSFARL